MTHRIYRVFRECLPETGIPVEIVFVAVFIVFTQLLLDFEHRTTIRDRNTSRKSNRYYNGV